MSALPTATGFWQAIGIGVVTLLALTFAALIVVHRRGDGRDTSEAPTRYVGRARVPSPAELAVLGAWTDYDRYRTQGVLPGERDYRHHPWRADR